MPICLQVADNFVNGIPFKRKLGKETALGVGLSRRGMGRLSKTAKCKPCMVVWFVVGFLGSFLLWVGCFLFKKEQFVPF